MTKNALVTGAAIRLGKAMAIALAKQKYNVAVHYHGSADEAEQTVREIEGLGCKAVALQADLTNENEVQALVPRAVEGLGGNLSVLVNSASIFEYDNIQTATRRSWDRHLESNLRAPFVLTQAFAEQAPEPVCEGEWDEPTARAMIVNMVDQRVHKLTPEFMSYTIAKMGLWTLTQTAAQSLAPKIRVNAIGPGPTVQGHRQSESHFRNQRRATVLKRGAAPDDVVQALLYFLRAPTVTGQLICVDGGQHLAWQTPDVLGVE